MQCLLRSLAMSRWRFASSRSTRVVVIGAHHSKSWSERNAAIATEWGVVGVVLLGAPRAHQPDSATRASVGTS